MKLNHVFDESVMYRQLKKNIEEGVLPLAVFGLQGGVSAHIIGALTQDTNRPFVLITNSTQEAKQLQDRLGDLEIDAEVFMPRETVFFSTIYHSHQLTHQRIKVMNELLEKKINILIVPIEALMTPLVPKEVFSNAQVTIDMENTYQMEDIVKELYNMGYSRETMVVSKGQFSIRGGIIDIYPPDLEHPFRIEFFDDEVDSIRSFDLSTQRSLDMHQIAVLRPCREVVLTEHSGMKLRKELFAASKNEGLDKDYSSRLERVLNYLDDGTYIEDLDHFSALMYDGGDSIIDYVDNPIIALVESGRINDRMENFISDYRERYQTYFERGQVLKAQYNCIESDEMYDRLNDNDVIIIDHMLKNIKGFKTSEIMQFKALEAPQYYGKIDVFIDDVKRWLKQGYRISVMQSDEERQKKLIKELHNEGIGTKVSDKIEEHVVNIEMGHTIGGYVFDTFKYIFITEGELTGAKRKKPRRSSNKKENIIKSFSDLNSGDLVVHENHGIGKYVGVDQIKIDGLMRDYMKIEYSGQDHLYIPVENMDTIQKFIGQRKAAKKLSKLGGSDWKRTKSRVKKAIEDMTEELVALYAKRSKRVGFSYSKDGEWQRQFEDMFPYQETPDQLRCIEEIKKDMEDPKPMERLLCGDVGFGKTEVAMRAMFKAVGDSKQVAVLVPTTILAQQHYTNMLSRFSKFPVRVEMLSRFRTAKQQTQIIKDIQAGVVDIVVGTHRLLSKDVIYKNLGLLVVDEEQRFGVKHKEQIKQMKNEIDVLSLSATPIPRTLHMSMIGIRDMSVIEDPPEDRYPIQTYVIEDDMMLVKEAIYREIERGGQVYFVHNRVEDIDSVTAKLRDLVPEAEIRYAHGQMTEAKLEKLMVDFYHHQFDVLVCTTIIETGLDIPNVNTMIIHHGERLGLSQLYQLRGRVGRSNRLAYCYVSYPEGKVLSEIAEKRLKAIKEFTELGAGFKIAMRDLEIRGAGDVLGGEQHGHLETVGYELYCKMLEDAVRKVKGEAPLPVAIEAKIELPVSAYIDEKYIADAQQKLDMYKRISSINTLEDYHDIEEQLLDRYGDIPLVVSNLLKVAYIKGMAQNQGIDEITMDQTKVNLRFVNASMVKPEKIAAVMESFGRRVEVSLMGEPSLILKFRKPIAIQAVLRDVIMCLEKISGFNPS